MTEQYCASPPLRPSCPACQDHVGTTATRRLVDLRATIADTASIFEHIRRSGEFQAGSGRELRSLDLLGRGQETRKSTSAVIGCAEMAEQQAKAACQCRISDLAASNGKSSPNDLRPHRHRHRPRRLRVRHSRSAARHEGGRRGEARHLRRHLPQRRLHPLQGAAARLRALRGGGTRLRRHGHRGARAQARPRQDAGLQGPGRERQRRRRRVPAQEEQDRHRLRHGQDPRPRQGRSGRRKRRQAAARGQEHRHRHRLGRRPAARHRHRRTDHRVVDRRPSVAAGAQAHAGGRCRRDRAGARLRVAPAGIGGAGGRVPRSHPARHGRRRGQERPAHPR